jgi:DNA topoisomerase I
MSSFFREARPASTVSAAADDLANTPAICRKSYVHETVVAAFENGELERFSRFLKNCRSPAGRVKVLARIIDRAASS